jgi:hypothetical protein
VAAARRARPRGPALRTCAQPPAALARFPGPPRRRRRRRRCAAGAPRLPGRRGRGVPRRRPAPGSGCSSGSRRAEPSRADRRGGPSASISIRACWSRAQRADRRDAPGPYRGEAQPAAGRQPLLARVLLVSVPPAPASPPARVRCLARSGARSCAQPPRGDFPPPPCGTRGSGGGHSLPREGTASTGGRRSRLRAHRLHPACPPPYPPTPAPKLHRFLSFETSSHELLPLSNRSRSLISVLDQRHLSMVAPPLLMWLTGSFQPHRLPLCVSLGLSLPLHVGDICLSKLFPRFAFNWIHMVTLEDVFD